MYNEALDSISLEPSKIKREIKTAITEVTVPVKVRVGSNYRIHPDYGHLGIESKNVKVEELIYFKYLETEARQKFLDDFGFNEDDDTRNYGPFSGDDIIVKYEGNIDKEIGYMELEFFILHTSTCS